MGQPLYDIGLDGVGILVLVHHNVLVSLPQFLPDRRLLFEELAQIEDQIIVIHHLVAFLVPPVKVGEPVHDVEHVKELCIFLFHDLFERSAQVGRFAQDIGKGPRLWKSPCAFGHVIFPHQGLDDLFHVRTVENGESRIKIQQAGVGAQYPVRQGVESTP